MKTWIAVCMAFLTSLTIMAEQLSDKEKERIERAATVFKEIMDMPDKAIPSDLLNRCTCVAVIPSMVKAGFVFGGRYGKGVVSCRKDKGNGPWGSPAMILLTGGSFGLQIGGAAVDVVFLAMGPEGINYLLKDKFTIGGDASAAAGPVGRAGSAETDALMQAKILTYSRSRGLFAGLELKGTVVKQDDAGNRNLYGRTISAKEIINGQTATPADAQVFIDALARYSPTQSKKPL